MAKENKSSNSYYRTVEETTAAVESLIIHETDKAQATHEQIMHLRDLDTKGERYKNGIKRELAFYKVEEKLLRVQRRPITMNDHMDEIINRAVIATSRLELHPPSLSNFVYGLASRLQAPSKATLPLFRNYRRREGLAMYEQFQRTLFTHYATANSDDDQRMAVRCCISGARLPQSRMAAAQLVPFELGSSNARQLFDGAEGADDILMSAANGLPLCKDFVYGLRELQLFIVLMEGTTEFTVVAPERKFLRQFHGRVLQFRPACYPSRAGLYSSFLTAFFEQKRRDCNGFVQSLEKYASTNLWSLHAGDKLRLSTVTALATWNGFMPSESIPSILGIPEPDCQQHGSRFFLRDRNALVCHYMAVWKSQNVNYMKAIRGYLWRGQLHDFLPCYDYDIDDIPDNDDYELYQSYPEE